MKGEWVWLVGMVLLAVVVVAVAIAEERGVPVVRMVHDVGRERVGPDEVRALAAEFERAGDGDAAMVLEALANSLERGTTPDLATLCEAFDLW